MLLRAGTFHLKEPVLIDSSDISVSAYPSEEVVVSGMCPCSIHGLSPDMMALITSNCVHVAYTDCRPTRWP